MKTFTKCVQQVGCMIATCVLLGQAAFAQDAVSTKAKADAKVDTDRKIEALDMLTVNVFGEEEFSGTNNSGLELRVSSTGEVTLYLLGSVEVAGKTPAELKSIFVICSKKITSAIRMCWFLLKRTGLATSP